MEILVEFKQELPKEILFVKDEVETGALSLKEKLGEVAELCPHTTGLAGASWADVAKRRKKIETRRLLR